jgi:hypothetical protein
MTRFSSVTLVACVAALVLSWPSWHTQAHADARYALGTFQVAGELDIFSLFRSCSNDVVDCRDGATTASLALSFRPR